MARQGYIEIPSLAQAGSREQAQWAETMTIQGLPPGTDSSIIAPSPDVPHPPQ